MSEKITIDIDEQKMAEVMQVFKRIADGIEALAEKDQPKGSNPRFVDPHQKKPSPAVRDRRGKAKNE